jgi:1H-pyrrole-2-carbonyl-[peptidyl-carrier protein] chlorinase
MKAVKTKPDFDVIVIGGGPAGAAMGAYLGKAGVKCAVLERELFPRPHVGESLVPSSTRVFKDLNFIDKLEEAKFPHKYGASWSSDPLKRGYAVDWNGLDSDGHADIRFDERPQAGVDRNYTYHVDRGKFDLLLLHHAHELGAEVYEGVRVTQVLFPEGEDAVVKFTMGRKELSLTAHVVVDASGRHTMLGSQMKLKVKDPVFDQYAIHTWFDGFDRGAMAAKKDFAEYIHIHFLPITNTWVWQIPISDRTTSVGVVTQKSNFAKSRESRERFFWECLGSRPALLAAATQAKQVHALKDEGDYSYAMTQICGDRFLLVGDAARFVDPIFSTGVSIALNSARFASRDLVAALEKGDYSRGSFSTYETTIRRGTKNWYEFIRVYYRLNVLFTYFIRDSRYRLDVLKLLQGDVYDEDEPEVLTKMREMVSAVETDDAHPWHTLLGDLTSNAFRAAF